MTPAGDVQQATNDNQHGWTAVRWWALPVVVLLVAMVYWPGLRGGYVFDDFPNIVDNLVLHVTWDSSWMDWLAAVFSSPASDLQRPLAMLSFAINHAVAGLDPYPMKLTNLAIHLLNTGLVFGLSRRVLHASIARPDAAEAVRVQWIALWIAAAWALNPINLMAVLFVVQRMESLCHTFVFAGLWLYLIGRARLLETGRGWVPLLAGLIGGITLGCLVKESAVLLPLYAAALEWTLLGFASLRRTRDRRLVGIFGLLLVLPGTIGLAWMIPKVLSADAFASRNFTLGERLLTEGRVVIDYLHWTLLPNLSELSLYHDDYVISRGLLSPPSTLVSLAVLAALVAAMAWLRRRRPLMALGIAWFLSAQLLTATIIPLELMFEHRNYFASLGLCLVLADGCLLAPRAPTARRVGIAAAVLLLMLYAGLTALRAREWDNQLRFALTEVAKHPQSPRATYDIARDFILLSDYRQDSPYTPLAFAALDRAMAVPDATVLPETASILLASRSGLPLNRQWWAGFKHKLRTQSLGPQVTGAIGTLVDCQLRGKCSLPTQDMVDSFEAALARGRDPELLNLYGNYTLNVLRDPQEALQLWHEAATRAPRVVQYQATMARMLIASGQYGQANQYIANVRRLGRIGQNESLARDLEHLASTARRTDTQTPP